MKKLIAITIILMFTIPAMAGIDTSWNVIKKPHGNLHFNYNAGTTENPEYYPLRIQLDMPVETSDGKGKVQVQKFYNVGTSQATPFDFSTTQGLKDIYTALPAWAKGAFKEAVVEGINLDISQ